MIRTKRKKRPSFPNRKRIAVQIGGQQAYSINEATKGKSPDAEKRNLESVKGKKGGASSSNAARKARISLKRNRRKKIKEKSQPFVRL